MNLHGRFVRRLEARYEQLVGGLRSSGPDSRAHQQAFEAVKDLGREALAELGRRELYPWRESELAEQVSPDE